MLQVAAQTLNLIQMGTLAELDVCAKVAFLKAILIITTSEVIVVTEANLLSEENPVAEETVQKWVYLFEEGSGEDKALLGGKGAGLSEMTRAGLPVPPGLLSPPKPATRFFANQQKLSRRPVGPGQRGLTQNRREGWQALRRPEESVAGFRRSGAAFSMPGMMDTVLNLGLNEETVRVWRNRPETSDLRSTPTVALRRSLARLSWGSLMKSLSE